MFDLMQPAGPIRYWKHLYMNNINLSKISYLHHIFISMIRKRQAKTVPTRQVVSLPNLLYTPSAENENDRAGKSDHPNKKLSVKIQKEIIIHSNFQNLRDNSLNFSDVLKLLKRRRSLTLPPAASYNFNPDHKQIKNPTPRFKKDSRIEQCKRSVREFDRELKSNRGGDTISCQKETISLTPKLSLPMTCQTKRLEQHHEKRIIIPRGRHLNFLEKKIRLKQLETSQETKSKQRQSAVPVQDCSRYLVPRKKLSKAPKLNSKLLPRLDESNLVRKCEKASMMFITPWEMHGNDFQQEGGSLL